MIGVLRPLKGSDTPIEDQDTFLKAQLIFWLIGATDGHAENFSVFLSPGGSYRMTPFYDIVSAQGALNARQLQPCPELSVPPRNPFPDPSRNP